MVLKSSKLYNNGLNLVNIKQEKMSTNNGVVKNTKLKLVLKMAD